jgi:hypothetical protein
MRIVKVLCSLIASVAFFVLLAQSDSDYQGWMKQVAANNGKLAKGIAAKDAGAAEAATTLESVFKQVEAYWSKKGVADAAGFAKQAHMSAAAAGKAIGAGDWDKATAESKNVAAQCGNCHGAHRGGEKGAFTIK